VYSIFPYIESFLTFLLNVIIGFSKKQKGSIYYNPLKLYLKLLFGLKNIQNTYLRKYIPKYIKNKTF